MSESNLWQRVQKGLGSMGHLQRIESGLTAGGIPDVNYCLLGCEGWIELKHGEPVARAATVVFRSQRGLDSDQIQWLRWRRQCGGRAFILTQVGKWVFLIDGKLAGKFNLSTMEELLAMSIWRRSGGIRAADWEALAEVLRFS